MSSMPGDFIRRSDSGGTTGRLQAKGPRWYSWLVPTCTSRLVVCGIVFVLVSQTALTDNASPRATSFVNNQSHEHKLGERDDGCPGVPCPELVVQLPETQKSGPQMVAPLPEAQKSGSEIVVPLPQGQKSGSEMVVPLPEAQKSEPEMMRFALPQLVLPADVANKVGHKIWINETGGDRNAIASWNANEEFASLGIGHFIWFP